eukprot:m.224516 g.224516  ORF g.224516 m.224516 type:complete len:54 (-) comp22338_c0_seq4:50-211(-)
MKKLHDFLLAHTERGGLCLVAAKVYYFGVGGGTSDFCQKENVRREILKLTRLD